MKSIRRGLIRFDRQIDIYIVTVVRVSTLTKIKLCVSELQERLAPNHNFSYCEYLTSSRKSSVGCHPEFYRMWRLEYHKIIFDSVSSDESTKVKRKLTQMEAGRSPLISFSIPALIYVDAILLGWPPVNSIGFIIFTALRPFFLRVFGWSFNSLSKHDNGLPWMLSAIWAI